MSYMCVAMDALPCIQNAVTTSKDFTNVVCNVTKTSLEIEIESN